MKKLSKILACLSVGAFAIAGAVTLSACNDNPPKAELVLNENVKTEVAAVVDYVKTTLYTAPKSALTEKIYTVEGLKAKNGFENLQYYTKVATLKNFSKVEKLRLGNENFIKDQTVAFSIGNSKFIEDKVWYVEDNTLYVAAPILQIELAFKGEIEVEGVKAEVTLFGSAVTTDGTMEVKVPTAFTESGNTASKVDDKNEYNVHVKDNEKWFAYDFDATAQKTVLTKKKSAEDLQYGVSNLDQDGEDYVLGQYVVTYGKDKMEEAHTKYNGKTYEVSVFDGGKVYTTTIHITVEAPQA